MKPIVRKASLSDLTVLSGFMKGLVAAERPMDPSIQDGNVVYYDLDNFIQREDAELFVADLNGEIVASGYAKIVKDRHYLKHDYYGYLGFMFVPVQHRGHGYNQLILDALIDWCKARNIHEIRLDVYDSNEPAIRAYEKAGFRPYLINMRLDHTKE